jgi:hypothetical protein
MPGGLVWSKKLGVNDLGGGLFVAAADVLFKQSADDFAVVLDRHGDAPLQSTAHMR